MCDEKLNLAKLLSSCPKGTKLWSPLYGTYYQGYKDAECLLFPSKDRRDWSNKDGDIVVSYDVRPFILKGSTDGKFPLAYGGSKSSSSSTWWRHIIPLDKLTVNKEGIVELDKVTDYGTHNYYA